MNSKVTLNVRIKLCVNNFMLENESKHLTKHLRFYNILLVGAVKAKRQMF